MIDGFDTLFLIMGIVIGFGIGKWYADGRWRKDALDQGLAEYNLLTSEWQWKNGQRHPQ